MQRSLAPSVALRDKAVSNAVGLMKSPRCPDQLSLKSLFLAENGTKAVAAAIPLSRVRSLDLSGNVIPDIAVIELVRVAYRSQAISRLTSRLRVADGCSEGESSVDSSGPRFQQVDCGWSRRHRPCTRTRVRGRRYPQVASM